MLSLDELTRNLRSLAQDFTNSGQPHLAQETENILQQIEQQSGTEVAEALKLISQKRQKS